MSIFRYWRALVLLVVVGATLLCFGAWTRATPELIGLGRAPQNVTATPAPQTPIATPSTPPLALIKPELTSVEPDPETLPLPYTDEELEILALIIYQEAGGDACLDSSRQMVGEVFLNRVASPHFPDTFYEVATQPGQYGRLSWTGLVWPERAELPQEQYAVQRAYVIAEALLSGHASRFLPNDVVYQAEFSQGVEVVAVQDGIYFCR